MIRKHIPVKRYFALAALALASVVAYAWLAPTAHAQPATVLKIWFFTSENSTTYQCHVRPLVQAVNNERDGALRIEVTFSPGIRPLEDQFKPIMDGSYDITIVTPAYIPARFTDNAVLTLPGLFRNNAEGISVYRALVQAGALSGYQDLFVLGAFLSMGESIHSRKPTEKLSDLRGQNIRVNNEIEASALRKLGANPVFLSINQTVDGLGQGTVDGAMIPTPAVLDFGVGRMTTNHYLLPTGAVSTALVMPRSTYSRLPRRAQEILQKYSGTELVARTAACMEAKDREITMRLQSDSRRKATVPSPSDLADADRVFKEVVEEWAAQSTHNRELLTLVKTQIANLRSPSGSTP